MKRFGIFFIFLFAWILSRSQSIERASEAVYKDYMAISDAMSASFPEDEMKTFRRNSFSEEKLQTYLSQHIKRMDLLPQIQEHYTFKLHSYLHSGNWYREIGFPWKSIEAYNDFFKYYRLFENELTESEKQDFVEMQSFAHSILAENYAKQLDFKNAAKEHRKNIAFAKTFSEIFYPSSLNNYGVYFYRYTKEIDSALYYFKKAYVLTQEEFPLHTLNGSIRDNIADIYIDKQNFKEAELLYKANFEFYKTALNEKTNIKDTHRLILAGAQLVNTQIKLDKIQKAQSSFDELAIIMEDINNVSAITSSLTLEYLNVKAELYKKQQNFEAAFNTVSAIQHLSDSLYAIEEINNVKWINALNNVLLDKISFNFKIERLQKENQITSERQIFWIVSLISIVILTLLISLFIRRRQHLIIAKSKQLLAEQQLENTNLKVEQLNKEIDIRERDLSDFAVNLAQNKEWAREIEGKLQRIRETHSSEMVELINDLEYNIQRKVLFDDYSQEFLDRLDELGAAFYGQLQERFPSLTKTEIKLCSLIRLKIESRRIADIQNITLASLHTSRYRIRKKLNLSGDSDLDTFILSM